MAIHYRSQIPHQSHEDHHQDSFWTSRSALVLLALLVMGGALLFTEHRAHVLGILPFLFLLACPLLHMFKHGGHVGHDATSVQVGQDPTPIVRTPEASNGEKS